MIIKLQTLKGKTKLKFYQNIKNLYDKMIYRRQNGKFHIEEDVFSKGAQGISKIYHEFILLMKFSQTKPQVKTMNKNYHDFYYTVIKNKNDKEILSDEYENKESDYINFDDFIILNHNFGTKPQETILR